MLKVGLVLVPIMGAVLSVALGLSGGGSGETARTFYADVHPILTAKCAPCHQPNSSGPFSLLTYSDVRRRSSLVWEKSLTRDMPPCYANSDFGDFCWASPITDQEAIVIQEWVRQGMVEGPAPEGGVDLVERPWADREYDLNLQSPAIEIPDFRIAYWQAIPIELPAGARFIRGFNILPTTPEAVRSAVVGYIHKDKIPTEGTWETNGDLSAHVDGLIGGWGDSYYPWQIPADYRMEIPADSVLVVQMLYQPTGKPEDGGFEIALELGRETAKPVRYIQLGIEVFTAPENRYLELWSDYVLDRNSVILGVVPEARLIAVAAGLSVNGPGVKGDYYRTARWDPYWLGNYQLREPLRVPAGTALEAYFAYDNMPHGPSNEDRDPIPIFSGPGLEDEVFRMFVLVGDD